MINHKVKAHRGRAPHNQTWLLCIVDCSFIPARGYCSIVENRSAASMLPIISRVVRQGLQFIQMILNHIILLEILIIIIMAL
ncbi:hypothetical protein H312_01253 [Anncaliia algerae PRA339]|uniref:Uncharacterized protein n=1 Tax=Anncaliia algerae PRA339 TaxID=1288291 RepID=A0A059F320_9MICR|nr:hypothetical protein H312_01253 [Anncaliia algerae PRA339]